MEKIVLIFKNDFIILELYTNFHPIWTYIFILDMKFLLLVVLQLNSNSVQYVTWETIQ